MTARVVSLSAVLRRMGACQEARDWVRSTRNARFADTWNACRRAAWMWWLVEALRDYLKPSRRSEASIWLTDDEVVRCEMVRRLYPARRVERAILAWWAARGQS